MGIPKFFRWLSERYPKVNQRLGRVARDETIREHYSADDWIAAGGSSVPIAAQALPKPDPLSMCSTAPPIDRLYIDMNGVIHGCSHSNQDHGKWDPTSVNEEQIFTNVCFYLDRIVRDIVQPTSLVYLAIDGVAPRAKLNQQRSRRYRSGQEGRNVHTIYDAHIGQTEAGVTVDADSDSDSDSSDLASTFEYHGSSDDNDGSDDEDNEGDSSDDEESMNHEFEPHSAAFHSNSITPGTPFAARCAAHIEHFLQRKVSEDPAWQNLTVVFSGPHVPGEGEHKIMQFMREQQFAYEQGQQHEVVVSNTHRQAYHPNLGHCIMGQDGDLITLGLLSHEPNLVLLREKVSFNRNSDPSTTATAVRKYVLNPNFELMHMGVLRDYLAYEFKTSNVLPHSPWCLERCIDDFVLMTFFVGNDFLPHMPVVDIADEAFDLLFNVYREQRELWFKESQNADASLVPYLIDKGTIVSGQRLENFLQVLGKHETPYLENKKSTNDIEKARELEAKYGMNTIPSDMAKDAKEAADRAVFRERISQQHDKKNGVDNADLLGEYDAVVSTTDDSTMDREALFTMEYSNFHPVLTAAGPLVETGKTHEDEEGDAEALSKHLGNILRYSVNGGMDINISEEDLKGRYYSDKFGFSPFDAEKHLALRKAYIEGLVWNLKYYYEGCPSWEWYYPYHYGPMLSDLVGIDDMLKEISFEGKLGRPLRPFEQLMACMPPSHADVLPEPYRAFMTDPKSTIADFYPTSFAIDMNGKRWPWEAVVLLPFIDSPRLLEAVRTVDESLLTDDERKRNDFGGITVFSQDPSQACLVKAIGEGIMFGDISDCSTKGTSFDDTPLAVSHTYNAKPIFAPRLHDGVKVPLPGFPTLRDGNIESVCQKLLRVNVHGSRSRHKTSCLELTDPVPEILSVELLAKELIAKTLWINYPHFVEAVVTAVSDSQGVIRGTSTKKAWTPAESTERKKRISKIINNYVFGEKMVGTGGLSLAGGKKVMDQLNNLLYVRPFIGLKTMKCGTFEKKFAKFELEVPLFVTGWAPQHADPRLDNVRYGVKKNFFTAKKRVLTDSKYDTFEEPDRFSYTLSQQREDRLHPVSHSHCRGRSERLSTSRFYRDRWGHHPVSPGRNRPWYASRRRFSTLAHCPMVSTPVTMYCTHPFSTLLKGRFLNLGLSATLAFVQCPRALVKRDIRCLVHSKGLARYWA